MRASREPRAASPGFAAVNSPQVQAQRRGVQSTPHCGAGGGQGGREEREPSSTTFLPSFQPNSRYFPPFPSSAFARSPFSLSFSFFFLNLPSLPSSLRVSCPATATRIRLPGSVRLCVHYPILPSPGPDPLCLASLPEPPSSSLPVLHLPWPASSPPDAPLLFAAGACEEERAAGGRGVLETVRRGTGVQGKSLYERSFKNKTQKQKKQKKIEGGRGGGAKEG